MIGTLYEKNKELSEYSKQNAVKLGDSEFINKVEAADSLMKENLVINKINSEDSESSTEQEKAILKELKEDFVEFNFKTEKEFNEIKSIVSNILTNRKLTPPPELIVFLYDGRKIQTPNLEIEDNLLLATVFGYTVRIPTSNIEEIKIEQKQNSEKYGIYLESNSNSLQNVLKIISSESELYGITENKKLKISPESKYTITVIELDK